MIAVKPTALTLKKFSLRREALPGDQAAFPNSR
jgi:hypothetical protein